MVQLQDLPIEVLSHCLSFIRWPYPARALAWNSLHINDPSDITYRTRRSLMNISLVSRIFRDLAQPLLFRDFEDNNEDDNLRRLIRFLKAVIVRPQLGKYVQVVALHPIDYELLDDLKEVLPSQDINFFTRAVQELELGDQEQAWLSVTNRDDASILLALLLTKTPNLRLLYFTGSAFSMKPLSPLFARDPSFLSNLEELCIQGYEDPDHDIADFHEFLARPRLKRFISDSGDLAYRSILTPSAPNTLTMERCYLRHCQLYSDNLKKLTQACKKLTHFMFIGWSRSLGTFLNPGRTPLFDEVDLFEALLPHQDTLTHLDIEFLDGRIPPQIRLYPKLPGGKLPSLRGFTVMIDLTVQFSLLKPRPEFPSTLKRLTITDCNASLWNMTYCIATDCKNGRYPELEKIQLLSENATQLIEPGRQNIPEDQVPDQYFRSLRNLFKGTNVDYQIISLMEPGMRVGDDLEEGD
ncbi:hypothetical protein BDV36DRAFT_293791 [Aspergillus pseudocaelatus]|uniref:F-box domain-containing protein n=1 Tax=Aspergillus pseudocaelatus TaxID=1825620 RepID=A0ABQ6WS19_9EURO|nr:hypothetical protein BDV36DRAFT_293791 [Aspergillus pseudocaelatus]